jgi:AcrR family transcriptional regulator
VDAHDAGSKPSKDDPGSPAAGGRERYRRLPTGSHGLDPDAVKDDQRERLRKALVELIAEKGYQAVRIVDLARLSRVSQPTFYSLFADKEELFVSAYDEIAQRTGEVVLGAYAADGSQRVRMLAGMRAFAELAAAEPQAISLLVLGAFGAGAKALEHRSRSVEMLERRIRAMRSLRSVGSVGTTTDDDDAQSAELSDGDLTVKVILGGIREVTAVRLCSGRERELPGLVDELNAWAASYPRHPPPGLAAQATARPAPSADGEPQRAGASARARLAEGPLPSGRSELPRPLIVKSQRERIVDATAAIVSEQGLAALTIPAIAKRASVSHETFYAIYGSKHEAFLGAQKVGMHQALGVAGEAWEAQMPDWPRAIAAGLRALIDYVVSEADHAHLTIVDTFGASPETFAVREQMLSGFASYFSPGYDLAPSGAHVPTIAAEAVVGGCWQVLHHYIDNDRLAELPGAAPQLTFMLLVPFLGPEPAADVAAEVASGAATQTG